MHHPSDTSDSLDTALQRSITAGLRVFFDGLTVKFCIGGSRHCIAVHHAVYHGYLFFFFSSRRRHTRSLCDWSSDVCSSDLGRLRPPALAPQLRRDPLGGREHAKPVSCPESPTSWSPGPRRAPPVAAAPERRGGPLVWHALLPSQWPLSGAIPG